jgi:hypothetical protein
VQSRSKNAAIFVGIGGLKVKVERIIVPPGNIGGSRVRLTRPGVRARNGAHV